MMNAVATILAFDPRTMDFKSLLAVSIEIDLPLAM
jgi:hypothetical protein